MARDWNVRVPHSISLGNYFASCGNDAVSDDAAIVPVDYDFARNDLMVLGWADHEYVPRPDGRQHTPASDS